MPGMFESEHVGEFRVAIEIFNKYPDILHEVFLDVLPIRTVDCFVNGHVVYTAISDNWFSKLQTGHSIPQYRLEFSDDYKTFKFIKE